MKTSTILWIAGGVAGYFLVIRPWLVDKATEIVARNTAEDASYLKTLQSTMGDAAVQQYGAQLGYTPAQITQLLAT